ncbi:MAG: hypothetical protein A2Z32_12220 [Chloroflexi bacterium RBG_16_69_14]|nr:MAG: hypothetical protein A2Z32_12220 [Chloroflexi bacterium RBG_16_69_14]
MDDDYSQRLLTKAATSLDRIGATMGEITEITRRVSQAQGVASGELDRATAEGRRDAATRNAILREVVETTERIQPRLETLTTWLQVDVATTDATVTMVLDRAADYRDDDAVRRLIREIVGLGAAWTKFSEQQDQTIKAMNSLMEHEALRKAVSRRAAALERVIAAGAPLTVIAEQARSLTDR